MIGGLQYTRPRRPDPAPVEKVSRDEAVEHLERVIDQQERKIGEAFRQSIERIKEAATIEAIADRLEEGDIESAVATFRPEVTDNEFQPLASAISGAVIEGGRAVVENLEPVRNFSGNSVNFVFDATNPRLSQFAQDISATRIREVGNDVRQVVRDVIQQETVAGTNPIDTARRVRESVGLTEKQEQSVDNFRRQLELAADGQQSAVTEARSRELRDKRFAIKPGMSQEQIEKQVARYRERFVKHRAETIARTESTRAVNGASRELMKSYVEQGKISEAQVRRKWIYTKDENTRAEHRQIPALNPNGVGLNESFQTPLGPLRFPGDPQGTAENTVNCRCTVHDRVISAELIEDEA